MLVLDRGLVVVALERAMDEWVVVDRWLLLGSFASVVVETRPGGFVLAMIYTAAPFCCVAVWGLCLFGRLLVTCPGVTFGALVSMVHGFGPGITIQEQGDVIIIVQMGARFAQAFPASISPCRGTHTTSYLVLQQADEHYVRGCSASLHL